MPMTFLAGSKPFLAYPLPARKARDRANACSIVPFGAKEESLIRQGSGIARRCADVPPFLEFVAGGEANAPALPRFPGKARLHFERRGRLGRVHRGGTGGYRRCGGSVELRLRESFMNPPEQRRHFQLAEERET